jgi:hypothetical protein
MRIVRQDDMTPLERRYRPVRDRMVLRLPELKQIVAKAEQELKDHNQPEDACPVSIIRLINGDLCYKVLF